MLRREEPTQVATLGLGAPEDDPDIGRLRGQLVEMRHVVAAVRVVQEHDLAPVVLVGERARHRQHRRDPTTATALRRTTSAS